MDVHDVVNRIEATVYNQGPSEGGQPALSNANGNVNVLRVLISGEGVSWKSVGMRVQDLLDKLVYMQQLSGPDNQQGRREKRELAGGRVTAKAACAHDARLMSILRANFRDDERAHEWEEVTLWDFYSSCQAYGGGCD